MGDEIVRHDGGGFRFLLDPSAAEWFREDLIPGLDRVAERDGVHRIKRNNVRTVYRVPAPGGAIILKRYHVRGPREWLKYLVVASRAASEWRAARRMTEAGLPTVRALMTGEKRKLGVLVDACFASGEIPGGEDFVPFMNGRFRDGDREELRREHLARLADLIRQFHDAGFLHGDLHSGNLLVTGEPEDSALHILDLHTVKCGRKPSPAGRRANLGKLLHSLGSCMDGEDRRRFVARYDGDSGVLGDPEAVLVKLEERMAALERRRVASRTKRCLRRSSSFDILRVGPFRIHRRREVDPGAVLMAVGDHLLSRRHGGREVLKDSHRSAITRQVLAGPAPTGRVVLKETKCRGLGDIVKNALRRPRGLASWINGNGLRVRRVGVAKPLALVLKGVRPFVRETWLVMEDLRKHERLDLFVLRRYAGNLDSRQRAEKLGLVRALAELVGDLHRQGIYHGDLKAVNVFVRVQGGRPQFRLVDYDRVRFGTDVGRRRRIKNLAQLAASVAVLISLTDRLRFFRWYAPDAREEERIYNQGVESELRKRIVVRMEPIE